MGDMLRSEQMTLCQIFIPSEAAYFVISELGEIGIVQFRDVILSISLSIVLTKLIHSLTKIKLRFKGILLMT
jgi:hypothetical protein